MSRQVRYWIFATASLMLVLFAGIASLKQRPQPPPPPRLAIVVVVDQLRGDYLDRWSELFCDGGFRRLMHDGAWFRNCHYPYSNTVTGAGHASLVTGCSPRTHGIVGNEWFDRAAGTVVNCAASPRYQTVPPPNGAVPAPDSDMPPGSGTPERLLVPTLADALKEATNGEARVVGLSFKDRGAILLTGAKADACYWFESATGRMVTSTYYRDRVHPWVAAFNDRRAADAWFAKSWSRLRTDLDYEAWSGPDDAPGEGNGVTGLPGKSQGVAFPHPMNVGLTTPGKKYYEAVFNSPFGNELLLELVCTAIEQEDLGRRMATDLLCVSFSSNDAVGHTWGPDSQEVLDVTLRTDFLLRDFLDCLDRRVGKDRYYLVLSADHGICPLPEASRARGIAARRVPAARLVKPAEEFLRKAFGGPADVPCFQRFKSDVIQNNAFYFSRAWLQSNGANVERASSALAGWLRGQPDVETACTREELAGAKASASADARAIEASFHPDRCGDVVFVLQPYCLLGSDFARGTSHGTPHAYDTHVPLLVYGPGIQPGARLDAITPQACAPILAQALGIPAPPRCDVDVPSGLFAATAK